jgi:hypothetical protein
MALFWGSSPFSSWFSSGSFLHMAHCACWSHRGPACLVYLLTLKMEAVCSSETSVDFYLHGVTFFIVTAERTSVQYRLIGPICPKVCSTYEWNSGVHAHHHATGLLKNWILICVLMQYSFLNTIFLKCLYLAITQESNADKKWVIICKNHHYSTIFIYFSIRIYRKVFVIKCLKRNYSWFVVICFDVVLSFFIQ